MAVSQQSPSDDSRDSNDERRGQRAKTFSAAVQPASSHISTMTHSLRRTLTASLSSFIPSKTHNAPEPAAEPVVELNVESVEESVVEESVEESVVEESVEESVVEESVAVPIRITRSATCRSAENIAASLESLGGKHTVNVPSPLVSGFSPQSTRSTKSSGPALSSGSSLSPESMPDSDRQQQPAPRSLLNMLSFVSLLSSKPSPASPRMSSPRTPTSPFSLFAKATPPRDSRLREKVRFMVAEYMEMTDRQTQGFIDCSMVRRRLGVGPRKLEKRELYYEVFGSGPKRLFLIMGMIGSTMYWRLQTRYFSSLGDYTICVFDNCGSGKSTIAPGPYRISQLAKDAYRVLGHLGWSQNIHVVGISLGGMIAQEMCLQNNDDGPVPRFASVAFVDTWHSAALALPTAREVTFAFKGMSAFGTDPRHLIDLVFSREWVASTFHDAVKEARKRDLDNNGSTRSTSRSESDELLPTNKQVMLGLFQAIEAELHMFRAASSNAASKANTSQSSPGLGDDSIEPTPELSSPATKLQQTNQSPVHHSASASAMQPRYSPSNKEKSQLQPALTTPMPATVRRREVSGDLHQFMACLGHRLSAQRVRLIHQLNKKTRFLVIHGEKDRVIRPICGRSLAKLLECPIVWIKNAGHMPPIDAHCTFNLILRAFTSNEKWLNDLPDHINIVPAPWDDQVKVRRWISNENLKSSVDLSADNRRLSFSVSPSPTVNNALLGFERKRRDSKLLHLHLSGPLDHELLIVDETHAELAGRIIPPNSSPQINPDDVSSRNTPSLSPDTLGHQRKLVLYGALVDAPFRIRRYDKL
ncbi:hypothetical protein J3B02_000932 [Coemansia erecta]|nr:hypothetical protein J3B02_000932 [Coemansia erecta]